MSIIYTNIQQQNKRDIIKYPFTEESLCSFNGQYFPPSLIQALKLYVTKATFPLFIHKASITAKDTVNLQICDYNYRYIGTIYINKSNETSFIYNINKNLIGTLFSKNNLIFQYLYSRLSAYIKNQLQFSSDNFIIAPSCIDCLNLQGCQGILIDNNYMSGQVDMYFDRNCYLSKDSSAQTEDSIESYCINIAGDINISINADNQQLYGFRYIIVNFGNKQDMNKKHLFIQHSLLSDLRVITSQDTILFTGVS